MTETEGSYRVKFLATRFVPDGYTLIESGFVYGKGMTEDDLKLTNVGTTRGTDDGIVKTLKNSNTASEGQFALTYGVSSMESSACVCPYLIFENGDGSTNLIYGTMLECDYTE